MVTEPLSRPQHSYLRNRAVITDVTGDLGKGWRGHRCASSVGSAVTDSPDPDVAVVEVGRTFGREGDGEFIVSEAFLKEVASGQLQEIR